MKRSTHRAVLLIFISCCYSNCQKNSRHLNDLAQSIMVIVHEKGLGEAKKFIVRSKKSVEDIAYIYLRAIELAEREGELDLQELLEVELVWLTSPWYKKMLSLVCLEHHPKTRQLIVWGTILSLIYMSYKNIIC